MKSRKLGVAIIGPGNIGMDLMMKIKKSNLLEVKSVVGIDPESNGLKMAEELGIRTTIDGIEGLMKEMQDIDIVFDATGAKPHRIHAPQLKEAGVFTVDLTPAAVGPYVIPAVNLEDHMECENVNMVTCGGQATVPIVNAINRIVPVLYAEVVATISSKSAGPGTRQNIDEFTQTTREALMKVGGAKEAKTLILLNPAEPPILMRNTIYTQCDVSKIDEITNSVNDMVDSLKKYVPGYSLKIPPFVDNDRIVTMIEVEGAGDYLPEYAGNLDIITSASIAIAERYAEKKLGGQKYEKN